jgi:EAL domain-containing protein (putative c-di-GMP-specific phosphodiesterase class I)
MSRTLSDADVQAIADAISAKPAPIQRIGISVTEAQAALGCRSVRATLDQLKQLGVKQYIRGRYRMRDLENAVARRTRS